MAKPGFDLIELFDLEDLVNMTGNLHVKAGILEGATNNETGMNVATYAAFNEFGTTRAPARPFMRRTFEENEDTWVDGLGRAIGNGRPPEQAMQLLGMRMADDIVQTIAGNMPPPNAESTMRRKRKAVTGSGAAKGETHVPGTLVDTGSMINAVNYEVVR